MEEENLELVVEGIMDDEELKEKGKELDLLFDRLWQTMLKDTGLFDK
jgi:hypothetical protein